MSVWVGDRCAPQLHNVTIVGWSKGRYNSARFLTENENVVSNRVRFWTENENVVSNRSQQSRKPKNKCTLYTSKKKRKKKRRTEAIRSLLTNSVGIGTHREMGSVPAKNQPTRTQKKITTQCIDDGRTKNTKPSYIYVVIVLLLYVAFTRGVYIHFITWHQSEACLQVSVISSQVRSTPRIDGCFSFLFANIYINAWQVHGTPFCPAVQGPIGYQYEDPSGPNISGESGRYNLTLYYCCSWHCCRVYI